MKEFDRTRWQCRRGMLELDLVLTRFLDGHYPRLDADGKRAFDQLLAYPDHELWNLILGRAECGEARLKPVVALLREC